MNRRLCLIGALGKIEALVVKSKIKTKDYSIKGQVTKCVKWQ